MENNPFLNRVNAALRANCRKWRVNCSLTAGDKCASIGQLEVHLQRAPDGNGRARNRREA